MITKSRATIEDLYRVEGKAELVNGEIVNMPPTSDEDVIRVYRASDPASPTICRRGEVAEAEPALPE